MTGVLVITGWTKSMKNSDSGAAFHRPIFSVLLWVPRRTSRANIDWVSIFLLRCLAFLRDGKASYRMPPRTMATTTAMGAKITPRTRV